MAELGSLLEDLAGPQAGIDIGAVQRRVVRRQRRRRTQRVALAAAIALVVVVAGTVLVTTRDRSARLDVVGPTSSVPAPARVADTLVYETATGLAALDPSTGTTRQLDVGVTEGWCDTCAIARVADGLVFVAGRHAFWLADLDGRAVPLGDADAVYEAQQAGTVWLTSQGQFRRVEPTTASVVESATPSVGWSPAPTYGAAGFDLPEGLVVNEPPVGNVGGRITVWNPTSPSLAWTAASNALFVSAAPTPEGSLVAWVRTGCDRTGGPSANPCDLHITNEKTERDVTIGAPAGTLGFIGSGRFSPDGSTLAAFAYTGASWAADPAADLVLVDVASGVATVIPGSHVRIGEPYVALTWSPDGSQLYFTGLGQPAKQYRPGDSSAHDLSATVTYSFAALSGPTRSVTQTEPLSLTALDGTRFDLTVPAGIVASTDPEALHAGVYADATRAHGWGMDARVASIDADVPNLVPGGTDVPLPPGSNASRALVNRETRRLGLQYGPWAVVFTGDQLDDDDIDLLVSQAGETVGPDGGLRYVGRLPLGPGDAPDLRLDHTGGGSLSLFEQRCSMKAPIGRTASGLPFDRIDDQAHGHLVRLCTPDGTTELWLTSTVRLSDQALAAVTLRVTASS